MGAGATSHFRPGGQVPGAIEREGAGIALMRSAVPAYPVPFRPRVRMDAHDAASKAFCRNIEAINVTRGRIDWGAVRFKPYSERLAGTPSRRPPGCQPRLELSVNAITRGLGPGK
jgi:hypothetical protein